MSSVPLRNPQKSIALPAIPAVFASAAAAWILTADGELQELSHERAQLLLHGKPVLVCHAPYTRSKLGLEELQGFDVLELFAFIHPAKFCVPTPAGLCRALGLNIPQSAEDYPPALLEIAQALLNDLQSDQSKASPAEIAGVMGLNGRGWPWTPFVFAALGKTYNPKETIIAKTALNVWRHLPEWAEEAPLPPPAHHAVTGDESRERLGKLLGTNAEKRDVQFDYATQVTAAFAPAQEENDPRIVLAEAGTGIGKTLGYLAPASVWAEKNEGSVWISTYTKNLQRQIDQELTRLYPDPAVRNRNVAVRKGRENYLCLLNLEEAAAGAGLARSPGQAIAAGIMARWAATTKDGDLTGAEFPSWLTGLLGHAQTVGLADRRGECIFAACDHYHRCFIERSVRKSKRAKIVIANHALVMISSALSGPGDELPSRFVFDEGHHLFDAADGAFAAHLSAQETRDFRRWLLGAEGGKRTRARGLKRRAGDLVEGDAQGERLLDDILHEARCLTAEGWTTRLKDGESSGPAEQFLALVYKQVMARAEGRGGPYGLETQTFPLIDGIAEKAETLKLALKRLQKPMRELAILFRRKLAEDKGMLDADTRKRLDSTAAGIERRANNTLAAWIGILEMLQRGTADADFVDWMEIERLDGRAVDVGLYRHWLDPMKPFAAAIRPHVQGMAVTSATLKDRPENWNTARLRTGSDYLTHNPHLAHMDSPFDYPARTKIFIINDVRKDDLGQVAGAYRALFEASGGGALGIFTAISRLRAVHERIAGGLEQAGISLYAQHVDAMDTGTLIDMFREDVHACLLGTDAVRDGVDVPGDALRLIVFDRVPWPRPNILHKARRGVFGGKDYDETITRLKLKQAFGRLIRKSDDRGVFVMLDPMLPSRLYNAFPEGVEIVKCGLKEAAETTRNFIKP
ncbi:MAG: ATP-dependent DNA helicase [Alphaproteobacteria bacterium]|nr:ATP-dependent DNA helicase [Alphaproteobacteria bacterium]